MSNQTIQLGPVRLCSWLGVFLFMATAPLGCGGCVRMETPVNAQEMSSAALSSAALRPKLEEVADELICDNPSCSKESLHECTGCEYAIKHRAEIAKQLEQGRSKEQILNWFGDTYGEHLLGSPRPKGFGMMAFVTPALAVLLGLIPVVCLLRSQVRQRPETPATTAQGALSQEHQAPVEQTPAGEDPRVAAALRDFDY